MEEVRRLMETDAIRRIAEQAPPPPDDALELLRATGCPIGRKQRSPDVEPIPTDTAPQLIQTEG